MEGSMDHGIVAKVSEQRGAIAAADAQGNPIILATALDRHEGGFRTSLALIDARTGETEQYWYPRRDAANGPNFCQMLASNGRYYVMPGQTFLEFDLSLREWTFAQDMESGTAVSMTEGPDGTIYAGMHPTAYLLGFNPRTREIANLGRLDPEEKYPSFLAADSAGWVYAGIGKARRNIVAFNPATKERRQLVAEADRKLGTCYVYKGRDGQVYGRLSDGEVVYGRVSGDYAWQRLFDGSAERVEEPSPRAPARSVTYSLDKPFNRFPDGGEFLALDLPAKSFQYVNPQGLETTVRFDYESGGALITSMTAGPGDKIYGSTCHPMHFFSYDPDTQELTDHGGLGQVGGGNFCGLAVIGKTIYGCAYCGGWMYALDTTRPWKDSDGPEGNPTFLGAFHDDLLRPRTGFAHPDKRHFIMAGYPQNGAVGGGMAIYDLRTRDATLLTHQDIIPHHSTITIKALSDGNIVGGTSVATPCGAEPKARTGKLYIMDWATRKVVFDTEPVSSAGDINCLEIGPRGDVYGITNTSQFFVFRVATRKVTHQADLEEFGHPLRPDQSLILGPDGRVYALLSRTLLRIDPDCYEHQELASLPAEAGAGIGICKGRLYYSAGSRLWSYEIGNP